MLLLLLLPLAPPRSPASGRADASDVAETQTWRTRCAALGLTLARLKALASASSCWRHIRPRTISRLKASEEVASASFA